MSVKYIIYKATLGTENFSKRKGQCAAKRPYRLPQYVSLVSRMTVTHSFVQVTSKHRLTGSPKYSNSQAKSSKHNDSPTNESSLTIYSIIVVWSLPTHHHQSYLLFIFCADYCSVPYLTYKHKSITEYYMLRPLNT